MHQETQVVLIIGLSLDTQHMKHMLFILYTSPFAEESRGLDCIYFLSELRLVGASLHLQHWPSSQ